MNDKEKRLKELIKILNEASRAYYLNNNENMSNFEYDKLYDELLELEKNTGLQYSNSPSIKVGYEQVESLVTEIHKTAMQIHEISK